MTWPPPVHVVAAVTLVVAAAWCDLRARRLPNTLTVSGALVAFAIAGLLEGWSGLLVSLAGWAMGLVLFLPLYAVKGMGAGDVKLLAAIGPWLGPGGAVWTALYGAIAGGFFAIVIVLARGTLAKTARNMGAMLTTWLRGGIRPVEGLTLESSAGPKLPYALPLAVGTLITLWTR